MGDIMKRTLAELEKDFEKVASKNAWDPADITRMKDLQKLMYYMDVRCAMKEGEDYPGSEYMPDGASKTFARGRNRMGQFTSGNMNGGMWDNRSGMYHYPDMYYDGGMSGRRYYDSERDKNLHKLHHMMENTDDESRKSALDFAIKVIEDQK